ncbi:hypothetical protein [Mycobacterium mantenii]|uniref:Integral membrane protein n=1 Tax=Mycobacterium mantenii TaxID=560555 RepID=A0A1A2TDX2_MYCNT|nr:hypothetical protein [Mycobacterium mantenii]OBH45158.1 hypothetical protein A5688_08110 [Mycobacterium mantenii]OBH49309.1 hypothetical protein A5687_14175 [Mycobacterium mantenii]OBH72350.1 hypothetical protein A5683_25665 [Mycobacterium mantenii]OBH74222.1 hypothetical protein A5682_03930 [Mycobacterium mantenii]
MSSVTGVSGITTRPLYDSTDSLLRFAVRADATLTGLCGLVIAFLADPLSSLTGLTSFQEYGVGVVFVLAGLLVFSLGALPDLRRVGIGVVVVNVAFTLASIVAAEALPLTVTGVALTLASGAYTAAFAALQYLGLRRLAA